jgi:hypothetical protein
MTRGWLQRAVFILLLAVVLLVPISARAQSVGGACSGNAWAALQPSGHELYCYSSAWAYPAYQFGSANGASCSSTLAGEMQWTGSAMQYCDGTNWDTITAGTNQPIAFSFTNQTAVSTSSTISSNAVTLSGFTGTVSATCGTGCTAIARNGTWGSTTVSGFQSGDTIAIRQTSSASLNTATNATVTAGTTVSGTWSVTTTNSTPNAFSFTDVTGATTSWTYCSNAVALSGFTGTLSAVCNTGCTSIALNGVYGGTTVSGFTSGSTISICQIASSSASTAATASVTVGNTTSSTWTVTTGADTCPGVNTPGTTCPDGTVYAGVSNDGNVKMFVTPCDLGQSLVSGSCTGTRSTYSWNNGASTYYTTGVTNTNTGKTNTSTLNGITSSDSPYKAAQACAGLSFGGYSDWYLPASSEATVMSTTYYSVISGFTTSNNYWSSTELTNSTATQINANGGGIHGQNKAPALIVRCARHN